MQKKLTGLGRGLDALIKPSIPDADIAGAEADSVKRGVTEIDINRIEPNKTQPRKYFDEESLTELADSFKEFGVIQPIIVKEEDGYYSIIAGERRWRAARIAHIKKIPAIIKDYSEKDILQIALIENIQRQDLNPIEEATCYKRLTEEFFFTQEDLSVKVGKSRNLISYSMSLLNLDDRVQNFIIEGKLSAGHGRALLSLKNKDMQFEYAEKIIDNELSVRESEKLVKLGVERLADEAGKQGDKEEAYIPKSRLNYLHLESDLKSILGTQVRIRDGKSKGKIEIEYYSPEELDRLLGMLKKISDI